LPDLTVVERLALLARAFAALVDAGFTGATEVHWRAGVPGAVKVISHHGPEDGYTLHPSPRDEPAS
jgi:hypothetical protein